MADVDVLVPTCDRAAGLAVTLTSLSGQTFRDFSVVVSDQSEHPVEDDPVVQAVVRVLRADGIEVRIRRHLPRRGIAEQRQFLLDAARAPLVWFLDDDVLCDRRLLGALVRTLRRQGCGLVASSVVGLSFVDDRRPQEQAIELWDERVQPERVEKGSPAWERWRLHNAANLHHVAESLGATLDDPLPYKIAWGGGCVLYDAEKLRDSGGFDWWRELPAGHRGEDVIAQQRVMARHGGCGIVPSGAYHLELPTTVRDRRADAVELIGLDEPVRA